MTVIELSFPAGGRLHATPWGRHVNEGATEWPISPWRIQRALVATWHLKAREEIEPPIMASLMNALAGAAPSFELPAAVQSHTRHYMPGRGSDKPKVFDTFVQSNKPVRVVWHVDLEGSQRDALEILCERLGYLGRAESVVEARLRSGSSPIHPNSVPLDADDEIPTGHELVRVLCPVDPVEYETWKRERKPEIESSPSGKKPKAKKKAEPPGTLFEALHADTGVLQAQGWLIPPGSRWVEYLRKTDCFEPESRRAKRRTSKKATVARFAVSSTVPPRITQAISVAERLQRVLATRAEGKACLPIFTGKDADGQPMKGHRHTHIFCELGEKRDSIGFITLYAPDGYDDEAQEVIEDVQRKALWGHGGHDLDLVLLGFGEVADFDIPIFGRSKTWISLTPFVATRHVKSYADGRPKFDADGLPLGGPAQDLRRLIQKVHQITPESVGNPAHEIEVRSNRKLRTLQFRTVRKYGNNPRSHQSGVSLTVEFDHEVQGPFALGYGSHFGLGLFVPVES